jgi:glycosyltransferase involved in cell wall biosynthesis
VRRVPDTLLILLGAGARPVPLDGVHTQRPGELPPAELASLVAAADLFLAPLVDGVSTRRTSVMTALQHEVAVVGTDGPLTDSVLRGDALELTPVGDVDAFASAAERLAVDPERRAQLAAAGRSLYERDFDWPVLARELAAILAIR